MDENHLDCRECDISVLIKSYLFVRQLLHENHTKQERKIFTDEKDLKAGEGKGQYHYNLDTIWVGGG
jgi:hypothetical protein